MSSSSNPTTSTERAGKSSITELLNLVLTARSKRDIILRADDMMLMCRAEKWSMQELAQLYDEWANSYDTAVASIAFSNNDSTATTSHRASPEPTTTAASSADKEETTQEEERDEPQSMPTLLELMHRHHVSEQDRIVDLCCGSGMVGRALAALGGFTSIDGVDASPRMLALAREQGVYTDLYEAVIPPHGQPTLPGLEGRYDAVVSHGSFFAMHLDGWHLESILGFLRLGGLAFLSLRCDRLLTHVPNFEPCLRELVERRLCAIVERREYEFYYLDFPGVMYVLKKL